MKRRVKKHLSCYWRRDLWDSPKIYAVGGWDTAKLKYRQGRTRDKKLKRLIGRELKTRKLYWNLKKEEREVKK